SRCQRIDFAALTDADVVVALTAAGVPADEAAAAARLASGRLDRARSLAGLSGSGVAGLAALRSSAFEVARSLDGTGAAVTRGSESIQAVLAGTLAGRERDQKQQARARDADRTDAGDRDRAPRPLRPPLAQRAARA